MCVCGVVWSGRGGACRSFKIQGYETQLMELTMSRSAQDENKAGNSTLSLNSQEQILEGLIGGVNAI